MFFSTKQYVNFVLIAKNSSEASQILFTNKLDVKMLEKILRYI